MARQLLLEIPLRPWEEPRSLVLPPKEQQAVQQERKQESRTAEQKPVSVTKSTSERSKAMKPEQTNVARKSQNLSESLAAAEKKITLLESQIARLRAPSQQPNPTPRKDPGVIAEEQERAEARWLGGVIGWDEYCVEAQTAEGENWKPSGPHQRTHEKTVQRILALGRP